jgi:hypothetical protein
MKQNILKNVALSLLVSTAFMILTSFSNAQRWHAQASNATIAQAAPTEKTVEQLFTNIKVLNGMPLSQLYPAMRFMAASLGVQCG